MAVIDINAYKDLGLTRAPETKQAKDKLGQAEFLKLMTAQLMHQDPMKPMENGEFLTQIAQFGTVSGIEDMQKSFSTLSNALVSSQAMQASNLVGKSVAVPSSNGALPANGYLTGVIDLPANSISTIVRITDSAGQLVRTVDMGQQAKGSLEFAWDGSREDGSFAAPGYYNIKAEANMSGKTEALKTYLDSRVESVNVSGVGEPLTLNVAGVGKVNFSDVKQILQ